MTSVLTKINIPTALTKIMKIPSPRDKFKRFLSIQDEYADPLVLLQTMHHDYRNEEHASFFISLVVNDLWLYNCMFDSWASANVMSSKVMNQSGLEITRPYRNVCIIDSNLIEVCGLIEDLKMYLVAYPDISISMDVAVIDVPNAWGMLLCRKWVATLGGSL
jgi:hypothetical protein